MIKNFVILFIFSINLLSCSHLKNIFGEDQTNKLFKNEYKLYGSNDFVNHSSSLVKDYVTSTDTKIVKLNIVSKRYLNQIYQRIVQNNELLLTTKLSPKFFIIKDSTPFYFSMPNANFFFSTGMIKKYFKHEGLLIAALTLEIIKTHRNIYKKQVIVPVGFMRNERMMALSRIPLDVKMELNKWTFHAMKRSNFDGYGYLIWLQMLNKNSLDLLLLLGNSQNISKEEFLFKSFIIEEVSKEPSHNQIITSSSALFYKFINFIKNRN